MIEIRLEHAPIRRLGRGVLAYLLALGRGFEQLFGVRGRTQRALHRVARERRDFLADLLDVEVEQRLFRLGLPRGARVAHDHAFAVDLHADAGQRSVGRQLLRERAQRAQDPPRLDLRVGEALRRAQQHEVLERKLESAFFAGARRDHTRAHEGADAPRGDSEQARHLSSRIRLHGVRTTWRRRVSWRRA